MSEERLPVSEKITPIRHVTLFKTANWWGAVAHIKSFGRDQIALYLWIKKDGEWKRKQKFVIRDKDEWTKIKEAIENLLTGFGASHEKSS